MWSRRGSTGTATIFNTSGLPTFSGALTLNKNLAITNNNNTNPSTVTFSGGVTGTGNITVSGSTNGGQIAFTGSTVNMAGTITNTGTNALSTVTISAVIGPNVTAVNQNGVSSMVISGNNVATSTTFNANAAYLSITGTVSGPVVVSGGNLGGTGTINGTVTVNSIGISPGALVANNGGVTSSIGTLNVANNITLANGSTSTFQLGASGSNDVLTTTVASNGNITFGNGNVIRLAATTGFALNNSYTIVTANGTGVISGITAAQVVMPGYTVNTTITANTITVQPTGFTGGAATQLNWKGGSGTDLATAANWVEGLAPTDPSGPFELIFGATGAGTLTNSMAVGTNVHSLVFTAGGYTLTGNQLVILADDGSVNAPLGTAVACISGAGTNTVEMPLALSNLSGTLSVAAGATLNLNGILSTTGLTLGFNNTGSAGTISLGGANTYNGGFGMTGGTLNINAAAALGTSTFTFTGGTLDNTSGAALTVPNAGTLGTADPTFAGSSLGTLTFSGTGTLGATRTCTVNPGTLALTGVLSGGAVGLVKQGAGQLTLGAANTFTAGVTHSTGTLVLSNATATGTTAGTFTINGGTFLDVTAAEVIGAQPVKINGDFTFNGTNTLTLTSGAVTLGATPKITVNASTLTITGAISGTGFGITKNGAGTLALNGANTFNGSVTINGGIVTNTSATGLGPAASAVVVFGPGSTGTWTLGVATSITNLTTDSSTPGTPTLGGAFVLTLTGAAASRFAGNTAAAAFGFTLNNASGSLTLSGNNSHTGAVTVAAGTLNINSPNALGTTGGTSTLAITGAATLDNTSGVPVTLLSNNAVTWSGDVTFTGTNPLTFGSGTWTMSATRNLTLNGKTLTIGGAVAGLGIWHQQAGRGNGSAQRREFVHGRDECERRRALRQRRVERLKHIHGRVERDSGRNGNDPRIGDFIGRIDHQPGRHRRARNVDERGFDALRHFNHGFQTERHLAIDRQCAGGEQRCV